VLDAIGEIRRAQQAPLPGPGGWGPLKQRNVVVRPNAGLSGDEIGILQSEVDAPLPPELVALLGETTGIDGLLGGVDFTGRALEFEQRDVFPSGHAIAADGFGNFWVLDLTPAVSDAAPVFYACHDAPVVLYQSATIAEFLRELFRAFVPPHESAVDDVHEDRRFDVWRTNPRAIDRDAAFEGDVGLRAFVEELDERFAIVDLRTPEIGMGFSWGRYGPDTVVRRHGYERIFAYAPPVEKRRRLLRR
jgi:hypothetical protein